MSPYRVELVGRALGQVAGLPVAVFDALVGQLTLVSEDPGDVLRSRPTGAESERVTEFNEGRGFALFLVDDLARVVTVYHVTWAG